MDGGAWSYGLVPVVLEEGWAAAGWAWPLAVWMATTWRIVRNAVEPGTAMFITISMAMGGPSGVVPSGPAAVPSHSLFHSAPSKYLKARPLTSSAMMNEFSSGTSGGTAAMRSSAII